MFVLVVVFFSFCLKMYSTLIVSIKIHLTLKFPAVKSDSPVVVIFSRLG